MNPCGDAFNNNPPNGGSASRNQYRTAKITQIWSQEGIIMWEQDFRPGKGEWTDGSNYPDTQGLGYAHRIGGLVMQLDGSSYFMKVADYNKLAVDDGSRNQLWWHVSGLQ